ncbi:MAG TPA: ROK family protein [Nitrospira sp.]|nr:ROK family protein [Nitrospira sp.]HMV55572.1 ROK family protein [Nitrospira sp.]HMW84781.1 ROK family protein [Nitrospira sp.]HMX90044.1 ROK family protein [Nitrospira sp.]HMZ96165.1 ROK family protein [Nitrospira sp.]
MAKQQASRTKSNTPAAQKVVSQNGSAEPPVPHHEPIKTLVVDIGGTGIKSMIVNEVGEPIGERLRLPTPKRKTPPSVLKTIHRLAKLSGRFHRVSVGFPGTIRNGVILDAVNLDPSWKHFNLIAALGKTLRKKPVRAANDADVQGYGAISGKGVELVLTLGTGVGSSLFIDGRLVPNLEVGKNRLRGSELERIGKKLWNNRLLKVIAKLEKMFHYDRLYIGGGNAVQVDIGRVPGNVTVVSNLNGLLGGIALWEEAAHFAASRQELANNNANHSAPPKPAAERAAPRGR